MVLSKPGLAVVGSLIARLATNTGSIYVRAGLSALVLLGSSTLLRGGAAPEITGVSEYELKAAFLYNMARFVEWPEAKQSREEVTICIIGKDPFGDSIDGIVSGRKIGGKPVALKRLGGSDDARPCHVVFVGRSERRRVRQIVSDLGNDAVLTVGDTRSFTDDGGMIRLDMNGPRLTFSVNLACSKRSGIYISSKLLALARTVERSQQ